MKLAIAVLLLLITAVAKVQGHDGRLEATEGELQLNAGLLGV